MGIIKDYLKLKKQAKELSKTWDPVAAGREGVEAMRSANVVLAQQTAAATVAVTGEPATAQVNLARDTGRTVNTQPIVELSLLVFLEGQPPYPVTVQQIVPLTAMGRLIPGSRLAVKVDLKARETIWIDWAAS